MPRPNPLGDRPLVQGAMPGDSAAQAAAEMTKLGGAEKLTESNDAEATPEKARDEKGRFTPDADPEPAAAEGAEPEAPAETPEGADAVGDPEDAQPADDGTIELADSLDGLTEQLGLEPGALNELRVTVKEHGESKQVTLSEALQGHLAQSEFQRNQAQVAEERREIARRDDAIQAERQRYANDLQPLIQNLHGQIEATDARLRVLADEGDWDGYMRLKVEADDRKAQQTAAIDQHTRLIAENQRQAQDRLIADATDHERQLKAALPEWGTNPAKGKQEFNAVLDYIASQGVDRQVVDQIYQAPYILMARKSMLWDKAQAAKPETLKKVVNLPKVQAPGAARKVNKVQAKRVASMKQLRKTGSIKDAVATGVFSR